MTETLQKRPRGRPKSDDARRHPLSFRVNDESREKMLAVAEASGLSLAQEIERRLELTLRQEREALSEQSAYLGEVVKLATAMIERSTGKRWTEDLDTYQIVFKAIETFMQNNRPPVTGDAAIELQEAARKVDQTRATLAAVKGTPREVFAEIAHNDAIAAVDAVGKRYNLNLAENTAKAVAVADALGKLFNLRPA